MDEQLYLEKLDYRYNYGIHKTQIIVGNGVRKFEIGTH